MKNKRFIGLIGLGSWGRNIFRNLYELGVLHTACDSTPDAISGMENEFPAVVYTTSLAEMLLNPDIEAIVVASPAASHHAVAKQSLLSGRHVFVEKPLALTVADGRELVDIADAKDKILMVGHILHYHPAIVKLKECVSSGELGKIQYIYSNRLNIGKVRTEENILWSFAPHDISIILTLIDQNPTRISAFGGDYLIRGIYDTTLTTMEFNGGIKAHIFVSWLHPFKDQKLIVIGSRAMAVFDDTSEEKLFLYPHTIEWQSGNIPVAHKADCRVIPVVMQEPLKEELRHFINCVKAGKRPITDGHEGLRVLTILQATERSLSQRTSHKRFHALETSPHIFVHESAYVDEGAEIGEGTRIWHFSHILKGTKIGKRCMIGQNVVIGPHVSVGDGCKIQNNVSLCRGVTLEDEVFCGPSAVFTNVYNPRAFIERKQEFRETLIKRGATIGANATIVCSVTVGEHAMVGAGALVKSDVLSHAIVVGVPARQIGWACRCGTSLTFTDHISVCGYCGNEYTVKDNNLIIVNEGK
ncbi:MAG TPA: Gfo/Idh/MocA family oxidoreductase [Thermodesulfovibrionales bacterium]|nr:Gfo/Idh/MocA family oxidoreductase [Thermodesulfovibrionales bacterium]